MLEAAAGMFCLDTRANGPFDGYEDIRVFQIQCLSEKKN